MKKKCRFTACRYAWGWADQHWNVSLFPQRTAKTREHDFAPLPYIYEAQNIIHTSQLDKFNDMHRRFEKTTRFLAYFNINKHR